MTDNQLLPEEKKLLLQIARQSIVSASQNEPLPEVDISDFSKRLQSNGASFVTLTIKGELRGCIGAIEAYQALILDVIEHAAAAAMDDYRFPQVRPAEVPRLEIEISVLTPAKQLNYSQPEELLSLIRPGKDGVILRDGIARATFLPQVWEKLPDTDEFLTHLCLKMGSSPDLWKRKVLNVQTYQVEEFSEKEKI